MKLRGRIEKDVCEEEAEVNEEVQSDSDEVNDDSNKSDDTVESDKEHGDDDDNDNEEEGDSDNETPIAVSLKDSKKIAQDKHEREIQLSNLIKQEKRQKAKERENKNKIQQDAKKIRTPSLVPAKLDSAILEMVDEEVDLLNQTKQSEEDIKLRQKNKIHFSDDECSEKDETYLSDEENTNRFEACHLIDVRKTGHDISARDFLNNHFFGDRIKREKYIMSAVNRKRKRASKNISQKKRR
ncbi:myb-like protein V [Hydractinia symbiolongicarpus]|uniref:myb-like protein V n=1 Tax=Hydractinia symbiolongicarpus TaxID=13093 RepID=UPI00254A70B5|nr:myb-like protein V [Hydractinia symbiolongicarpus]